METTDKKYRLSKGDLNACFIRSNLLQGSWNFERMQALGYAFGIFPDILGGNGGLMGPLAGVGDPIFWGTARPVFAALGAGIAQSGSLLGPILFFVLFNAVRLFVRYWGIQYGYKKGLEIVSDMGGGALQKITEAASILGLFVMGALVNKWTTINISLPLPTGGDTFPITVRSVLDPVLAPIPGLGDVWNNLRMMTMPDTPLQSILNDLMPGLPALGLTFLCMYLLRKGVGALWLIFGIFGIGILGFWLKILA